MTFVNCGYFTTHLFVKPDSASVVEEFTVVNPSHTEDSKGRTHTITVAP